MTVERGNNLTREEARKRAALVSDVEERVHMDLEEDADDFRVEVDIRFACREPGASTFLDLIALEVEEVVLNGRDLGPEAAHDSRVLLDDLAEQNEVRVVARVGYANTGQGLHRFRDPVDDRVYCYTDSEPFDAHRTFPCFDQPDLKGVFTFEVTAPARWHVASNMAPDGEPVESDGRRVWAFAPTPLMSTYITAVVAG